MSLDVLNFWSINRYSSDFKNGRPIKAKMSVNGKWRLGQLKENKGTTIRFTAEKKVNGVWVTIDIPLDIQDMVRDAYQELEPAKEVGPLHHIAEVEDYIKMGQFCQSMYDHTNQWAEESRPQLQDDVARRQEEGYQRLYDAILAVGEEKNYECVTPYCVCDSWQERAECNLWQEKQMDKHPYDLFCICDECLAVDDAETKAYYAESEPECNCKSCITLGEYLAGEQMMRDDKEKTLASGEKWEPYVYNPANHMIVELTHEERLACKNETKTCDGWPFCDCDIYNPAVEETILQEAQRLVHSDRGSDYGHPLDDMSRTALIWQAILGVPVTAEQVALCMVGVKISRECNKSKRDNLTDIAGYAECLSMIHEERKRRENE